MTNLIIGILLIVSTWFLLRTDATGRLWMPGVIGVVISLILFWYFNRNKGNPKKK